MSGYFITPEMKVRQSYRHSGETDRAVVNGSTCQYVYSWDREPHRQIGIPYDNAGAMNNKQGSLGTVIPSALLSWPHFFSNMKACLLE